MKFYKLDCDALREFSVFAIEHEIIFLFTFNICD